MKLLVCHLLERCKRVDTGIVHQRIEPSKGLLHLAKDLADVFLVGKVAMHSHGLAALGLDLSHNFIRALFARRVVHHHRSTIGGQSLCNARANAFRRSCHDRDLIRQLSHLALLKSYVLSVL